MKINRNNQTLLFVAVEVSAMLIKALIEHKASQEEYKQRQAYTNNYYKNNQFKEKNNGNNRKKQLPESTNHRRDRRTKNY